ncbi:conserved hypothetical protein [Segniliparus rotundus DSM 44985]|uniref:Luciferase-like domain-containing protein n=1 Tax=Segniliparus rotundus (strain ATCC BAA-972 / CDC 1076 / CIP 108378 / DSM 44985 / JCM 13578) TaxID=640132 RepID=D6ZAC3_SEGRD|nr:LLM class F420-dependent oxidoreductase [Segniliparus rotundus]ADG96665.1 conserved hypothetical protein [Segniliparus rotundus DSM 44985]
MPRPIRVSLFIPPTRLASYSAVRDQVTAAEETGADILFGYDHFFPPEVTGFKDGVPELADPQPDLPNFEPLTALAAWAEQTSRPELGLLVTGVGYRNPDLLADIARTIDHISGGRHILGLGAGWYKPDYDEYGYEFGTFTTRFKLFEESLERITARFAKLNPAPTRHIPVLIGGGGEKKTLPLVAKHADIWHSFSDLESLHRKKDILTGLLEQNGRAADAVEISQNWPGAEQADAYVAAGVTLFNVDYRLDDPEKVAAVREIIAWRDKANG